MLVKPVALVPTNIFPAVPLEPAVPVQPVIVIVLAAVQDTALLAANFNECTFEPKAIVELLLRLSVEELVITVLAVIEVVPNFPPLSNI